MSAILGGLILGLAVAIFGFQLYHIFKDYHNDNNETGL